GGTDVVAVDFYAVDKDGSPVLGLDSDELTLKVNGHERPIQSLQFIRLAPGEDVDTPTPASERTPIAYGSNLPADTGRMVFILFETMSPDDALNVKTALPAFLDQLSPLDRVGLVSFPSGHVQVDLTADRGRLLAALGDVTVQSGPVALSMGAGCNVAERESI